MNSVPEEYLALAAATAGDNNIGNGNEEKKQDTKPKKSVTFSSEVKNSTEPATPSTIVPVGPKKAKKKSIKTVAQVEDKHETERLKELRRRAELEAKHRWESDEKVFAVQSSLLAVVDKYVLADAAKYLRPVDYAEVVEERAVDKRCGYPLCSNTLDDQRKGKYKVSLQDRRVYDQEIVGKYCCNSCHVASDFYSSRLIEVALWLRSKRDMDVKIRIVRIKKDKSYVPEEINPPGLEIKESPAIGAPLIEIKERYGDEVPLPSTVYGGRADNIDGLDIPNAATLGQMRKAIVGSHVSIAGPMNQVPSQSLPSIQQGQQGPIDSSSIPEVKSVNTSHAAAEGEKDKRLLGKRGKIEEAGGVGFRNIPEGMDPRLYMCLSVPEPIKRKDGKKVTDPKPVMTVFGTIWTALSDWCTPRTKRFLKGEAEVVEEEEDDKKPMNNNKDDEEEGEGQEEEYKKESIVPEVGMVTTSTRRKLLLQQFDTVLASIINSFGLAGNCLGQDFNQLVATFNLERRSVYFPLGILTAICLLLLD
eukprot:Ihof_evm22s13 gene=Ihof_evmTU22s13